MLPTKLFQGIGRRKFIEEKIMELHHHKRDLAASLLEGTDLSSKISTEELIRLINEA